MNYYNENDKQLVPWLRNLIDAGLIAPGIVDDRSIEDVRPSDLDGFIQCHFFAGIGVWSHALRRAGWPDDRPVWTGSCPCQPFSAAGQGGGFSDERHLWPTWNHLITQCRPAELLGEQVASKAGLRWLDLVQTDLEGSDYAFGKSDLCAAGVNAPHIRQRLFFVAHDGSIGRQRRAYTGRPIAQISAEWREGLCDLEPRGDAGLVADTEGTRGREDVGTIRGWADSRLRDTQGKNERGAEQQDGDTFNCGAVGLMADDSIIGRREECQDARRERARDEAKGRRAARFEHGGVLGGELDDSEHTRLEGHGGDQSEARGGRGTRTAAGSITATGHAGFWDAADWIPCRDGKARPVEPGTFPLAHGAPARVLRLRAYGNTIVAPLAEEFIVAYLEATCDDGLEG